MTIQYRMGRPEDSQQIAKLIHEVSVVSRFLYTDLEPGKSDLDLITIDVSKTDTKNSYKNCLVAEDNDQIVGVANFYPGKDFQLTEGMRKRFGDEKINHLAPIFDVDISNSLYISALITDAKYRGRQIGETLIAHIKEKATQQDLPYVTLHVWVDNIHAIRFYERIGFKTIGKIDMQPFRNIKNVGGIFLLQY